MSGPAHAPCEIDETASPDGWERALLDRQLETLDRLAELGLAVASAIKDRVTAPEASDTVVQHAALDFARAARAVRMTLALQSKLVRDFKTPAKAAAAGAGGQGVDWLQLWPEPEPERQPSEKSRLRDAVRRAAEESGLEPEAVERLDAEARERLERDDMDRIMHRPFDEIVALICEELGLDHLPREAAGSEPTRPPPLAGEVARRDGGGIPPPRPAEGGGEACERRTSPSYAPDG